MVFLTFIAIVCAVSAIAPYIHFSNEFCAITVTESITLVLRDPSGCPDYSQVGGAVHAMHFLLGSRSVCVAFFFWYSDVCGRQKTLHSDEKDIIFKGEEFYLWGKTHGRLVCTTQCSPPTRVPPLAMCCPRPPRGRPIPQIPPPSVLQRRTYPFGRARCARRHPLWSTDVS